MIKEQEFYPRTLALFTNPFYFARKGLLQNIKSFSGHVTGNMLDIGCGQKPYRKLFAVSSYTGLEFDTAENQKQKGGDDVFFYAGGRFPFNDSQFDSALSTEVLEHVFEPDLFLTEINRVLKKGGVFLLSVPFVWDEHEQPYDYGRYSSFGLKYLLEKHGFEIVESKKSMPDIRTLCQLINAFIYKIAIMGIKSYRRRLLATIVLASPGNILGTILARIVPENKDLYLDSVILARKK